jgi:hypothetical protein
MTEGAERFCRMSGGREVREGGDGEGGLLVELGDELLVAEDVVLL